VAKFTRGCAVPKSAIEKFGKDFYAFWASQSIAQGILPPLFRETSIYSHLH
jgi:hypothetical protein